MLGDEAWLKTGVPVHPKGVGRELISELCTGQEGSSKPNNRFYINPSLRRRASSYRNNSNRHKLGSALSSKISSCAVALKVPLVVIKECNPNHEKQLYNNLTAYVPAILNMNMNVLNDCAHLQHLSCHS